MRSEHLGAKLPHQKLARLGPSGRRSGSQRPSGLSIHGLSTSHGVEPSVSAAEARVRRLQAAAFAENTTKSYVATWKKFESWCQFHGYESLPAKPLVVAKFLAEVANLVDSEGVPFYAPGTLIQWLAAINRVHDMADQVKPGTQSDVKLTMAGIARTMHRPIARKAPLLLADLRTVLASIDFQSNPAGIKGRRDWTLLTFGFVGAYRRSELASFVVSDVTQIDDDGLHVILRRSKTDQTGRGLVKALPYGSDPMTCAPCAFTHWIRVLATQASGTGDMEALLQKPVNQGHVCRKALPELDLLDPTSPLFRPVLKNGSIKDRHINGQVVNHVVQSRMQRAGMDSSKFGAHSLRAGFVTQAFRDGATHHEVMRQTGHKSVSNVEIYSRESNPLLHNAVNKIAF